VYFAQTAPLIEFYREHKLLSEIDGARPIGQVSSDLLAVVGK
jgi:adenylate kinase family enzyme